MRAGWKRTRHRSTAGELSSEGAVRTSWAAEGDGVLEKLDGRWSVGSSLIHSFSKRVGCLFLPSQCYSSWRQFSLHFLRSISSQVVLPRFLLLVSGFAPGICLVVFALDSYDSASSVLRSPSSSVKQPQFLDSFSSRPESSTLRC